MDILKSYALSFVGQKLKGGDPKGKDPRPYASHFVQELLAGIGACPTNGVADAQAIFDYFQEASAWKVYQVGSLAFYGKSALKVDHVGMLVDPYRLVECGKSGTVRMRPIIYREDLIAVMRPRFQLMGVPN